MDDFDRKIIGLLQEDGRLAQTSIATSVGLSVSAVNERVRRLLDEEVITIRAIADPKAVGCEVLAFVMILLGRPDDDGPFRSAIARIPEVLEAHHVTGEWSYLLKVRTPSVSTLEHLLGRRIKGIPGVTRSLTSIALSSPKETTVVPIRMP
ncbi:MAG: Lrp/AsnC family transcriptional regulator [Opitutaceae bacterium]